MDHLKKTYVVRVTNIRTGDRADAEHIIQSAIAHYCHQNEEPTPKFKIAIVPSCDDPTRCDALLDFEAGQPFPNFLAELKLRRSDYVLIPTDDGDEDLTFDSHFHGFTQLRPTKDGQVITADIIAITGLDGHAYGSWASRSRPWRMWLRHWLARDMPNCRVMTYGYDSKLSEHNMASIADYRNEFLESLRLIRDSEDAQKRPVLFITHSFGGIILARALVRAQERASDPVLTNLFRATHGIAFFGVPHYGMIVDDIRKHLPEDHPRHELLDQITKGDQALYLELDHFKEIIEGRKLKSFVEGKQARDLVQDEQTHETQRTGNHVQRLDFDDAVLRLPSWAESVCVIHEDHSNMVKFAAERGPYANALGFLRDCEKEAPRIVQERINFRITVPLETLKFGRDKNFVGREVILKRLNSIYENQRRAGIYGLGGIGKSQIAIEYAYRTRDLHPTCHIFWVHASSSERFFEAFREIAVTCKIPGCEDPKSDIPQLVYQWLRNEKNGRWLLILDNVDDPKTLYDEQSNSRPIDYIPDVDHGNLLITSRLRSAAGMVVGYTNLCEVKALSESECLALVKGQLYDKPEDEDITRLCRHLENVPLAINQACAYLNKVQIASIASYIEQTSGDKGALLRERWEDSRRDKNIPNAVVDSFALSFAYLRAHNQSASKLLSIMAQYDRQNIPKFLLEAFKELDEDNEDEDDKYDYDDDDADGEPLHLVHRGFDDSFVHEHPDGEFTDEKDFDEALSLLLDFSLIKAESGHTAFDMHSLVQTSIIVWEKANNTLAQVQDQALRMMVIAAPRHGEYETWETWRAISVHTSAILSRSKHTRQKLYADLLVSSAWYLNAIGKYETALARGKQCLEIYQYMFGNDQPETLRSMNNLASTYMHQRRWQEAEELEVQVLDVSKRVFGLEHPNTLTSMNNLASTYMHQRRWQEAEELNVQVLDVRKRVLGLEHPDTLRSMDNLASIYWNQGRWQEAEELEVQVLDVRKRVLGLEHPDTLTSMNNLAHTFWERARNSEAIELMEKCVTGRIRVLGLNHENTKDSIIALSVWKVEMLENGIKPGSDTQHDSKHESMQDRLSESGLEEATERFILEMD